MSNLFAPYILGPLVGPKHYPNMRNGQPMIELDEKELAPSPWKRLGVEKDLIKPAKGTLHNIIQ